MFDLNDDIEFDNVNFIYPSRKDVSVLRNLSIIARAGQTTALVGSSGCGKSFCKAKISVIDWIYFLNSSNRKKYMCITDSSPI